MRAVVNDEYRDRTDDERAGHYATLARLIAEVTAAPGWRSHEAAAFHRCELPVATCEIRGGIATITEGVMDAVGFDGSAWTVLDWKTDQAALFKEREGAYRKQVERYAGMVGTVTGQGATGLLVPLVPANDTAGPATPPRETGGQLELL